MRQEKVYILFAIAKKERQMISFRALSQSTVFNGLSGSLELVVCLNKSMKGIE